MNYNFWAYYAQDNRVACPRCKLIITEGVLSIASAHPTHGGVRVGSWHHPRCIFDVYKIPRTDKIGCFFDLLAEDQISIAHRISRPGTGITGGHSFKDPVLGAHALEAHVEKTPSSSHKQKAMDHVVNSQEFINEMKAIIKATIHEVFKEEFTAKIDQKVAGRSNEESTEDLANVSKVD